MERLEAALAKAREQRQNSMGEVRQPRVKGEVVRPDTVDWATVPEVTITPERARRNRISGGSGGAAAAPYDLLRSRALRLMKEKEWTRVAVTSPDPACGKTTVALNLALSLSRQKDLRVMVLDFDLRRPSLNPMLGASAEKSLWEVLEGKASSEQAAVRVGQNLVLMGNASPARNPAELLHSVRTKQAIDDIEAFWKPDIMIFDLSPMLASDDNVGFLVNTDCALLVAAAESTKLTNVDLCEKELAQLTNVLGVVLNKCRYDDETTGYSYGSY